MIGPALLIAAATLVAPAASSTAATPARASAVSGSGAEVARTATSVPPGPRRYERRVVRHTNRARRAHDMKALRRNACLDLYAQRSADRIARSGRLTHQNLRPVLRRCGGWKVGENIAYGYQWPRWVVRAWMNSPGHRANILERRYRRIGVGVRADSNGTVWVSQVFAYRR
ncbi:CAP domain-containing protein [Mumia sp. Pv 4-285]|uniref:CAP domain-containing protein n=1 Tax=Mumia qirimensis TaxID=3234852 RepID=UPI00351D7984